MASTPLFGIIPAGQPLITQPSSTPSPTSFVYTLPASKPFSHVVVLMLPGVAVPPGTAAAIYLANTPDPAAFKFLGAIGPGKESAVFKISGGGASGDIMVGVSVEPEDAVAAQMQQKAVASSAGGVAASSSSASSQPSTVVLAQRIIQNAFNFLSSFSGAAGPGGVEVVPLKAFEEWWRKFESRVRSDPSFLERQTD